LENIKGNIGDAFIWVAVDETMDSVGRFIANIVAGKLDTEVPSNPHLICSQVLYHKNHHTVARFMNDKIKVLWPTGVHEEKVLTNFVFSCCGIYAESCNCVESVLH
jgi:hypothetical protein